jgi:glycosyltransferase involved in cell wall biosynthesis
MSVPSLTGAPVGADTPRCVAVDLTLLLPNGENGGSWVMTASLIRHLSKLLPHWSFVLLTSDVGHAEAAQLESSNTRRLCVEHSKQTIDTRWFEPVSRRLPDQLRIFASKLLRLVYRKSPTRSIIRQSSAKTEDELELLSDLRADLLFCPFGQFRMPIFHDARIPTVSVIYDLQFLDYPQFFSAGDVASRRKAYIEACQRSDALVCISDATRNTVLKSGLDAVQADHVSTVYIRTQMQLAPEPNSRTREDTLSRLNLQPNLYFLYPANLWRHKNHETLLIAVKKLLRRDPSWQFKVVCSGAGLDRLEELRAEADALGIGHVVLFPGYLPRTDLDILIRNCRGLVYPSLYEGFGIPLIEAMRARRPIACSNVTSLPEVGGDAVLTFDPTRPGEIAEALGRLGSDSALAACLVERGERRANEFGDSERMASEYLEIFLQTLSGSRRMSNWMHGLWSDGWTGGRVVIVLGARECDGELQLDVSLPSWAPMQTVDMLLTSSYTSNVNELHLGGGSSAAIRIPVDARAGWVEIRLSPVFRPAASGPIIDGRWLAVFCDGIRLITNGVTTDLAPLATA